MRIRVNQARRSLCSSADSPSGRAALDPDHPDIAATLDSLARFYAAQGRSDQAEPLSKRSLAIRSKTLGPDHLSVATSLEHYAALLRKAGRKEEVDQMDRRAKTNRDKHAQENPPR